jgi:aminoglycoside 3-N-acetyltransferase
VAALLEVLGPDGLLVAPTYTYWTQRFDPATDPGQTGRIAETVRLRPGAVRSWHPTHSVAAIGPRAAALCEGHHRVGAVSHGSPLDRLAAQGGKILLLGVGHVTNSTIHVGEAHANAPYLDIPFSADSFTRATVVTPDGELAVEITDPSGCSKGFGVIEQALRDRGAIRDGMIGGAVSQLMTGQDVIAVVVERLARDPGGVLCTDPHCYRCTHARERMSIPITASTSQPPLTRSPGGISVTQRGTSSPARGRDGVDCDRHSNNKKEAAR